MNPSDASPLTPQRTFSGRPPMSPDSTLRLPASVVVNETPAPPSVARYCIARQLGLVSEFIRTVSEDSVHTPLAFAELPAASRRRARVVAHAMHRSTGGNADPAAVTSVLSFLTLGGQSKTDSTAAQSTAAIDASESKRPREEATPQKAGPATPRGPQDLSVEVGGTPGTRQRQRRHQLASTLTPVFFLGPPIPGGVHLYARLLKAKPNQVWTAEETNRYFGRYGQVAAVATHGGGGGGGGDDRNEEGEVNLSQATPIKQQQQPEDAKNMPPPAAGSAVRHSQAAHLSGLALHNQLYEDFIITVDTAANALLALEEIDDPAVFFLALHDPSGHMNRYCASDVPSSVEVLHAFGVPSAALPLEDVPLARTQHPAAGSAPGNRFAVSLMPSLPPIAAESYAASVAAAGDDGEMVVPELVVAGLPYWITAEQLGAYCAPYGTVFGVRISEDDRNGCSQGAALVLMSTAMEAVRTSDALHGREIDGWRVVCGVLDPEMNVVSVRTGEVLLPAVPEDEGGDESSRPLLKMKVAPEDLTVNPRLWL